MDDMFRHLVDVPEIRFQGSLHNFRHAGLLGNHGGNVELGRLQRRKAEGLRYGRHAVDVRDGEEFIDFVLVQEAGEVEFVAHALEGSGFNQLAEFFSRTGHDEAYVVRLFQNLGGNLKEESRTFLRRQATQEEHEFFREFFLAFEDFDRIRAVVNGKYLMGVNGIVPAGDGSRVFADRDNGIRLFHAEFFNVVNPAAGIRSGPVKLGSVQVHHQGLARGFFHFHASQVGQPVVGVDNVKILLEGDFYRYF